MSLLSFSSLKNLVMPPDLAIDLGTANTRLYARGRGLIVDEPSLLKLDSVSQQIEAVGAIAAKLASVDPQSVYFSPLHAGVIADVEAASSLLKAFLSKARLLNAGPQRALACLPSDVFDVEREAYLTAAQRAGLTEIAFVSKPLAAAIGAGLDITSPYAQLVVEAGAGAIEIAVIRSSDVVTSLTLRLGCSDLHQGVSQNVANRYGVLLFPKEAERLTQEIGVASESDEEREFITTGSDLLSGRSVCLSVTNFDILFAVEAITESIVDRIAHFVESLAPDLACEVIETGICLTGGGALLKGFAERLSLATQLDVTIAYDPLHAVINGTSEMLQVSHKTGVWQHS